MSTSKFAQLFIGKSTKAVHMGPCVRHGGAPKHWGRLLSLYGWTSTKDLLEYATRERPLLGGKFVTFGVGNPEVGYCINKAEVWIDSKFPGEQKGEMKTVVGLMVEGGLQDAESEFNFSWLARSYNDCHGDASWSAIQTDRVIKRGADKHPKWEYRDGQLIFGALLNGATAKPALFWPRGDNVVAHDLSKAFVDGSLVPTGDEKDSGDKEKLAFGDYWGGIAARRGNLIEGSTGSPRYFLELSSKKNCFTEGFVGAGQSVVNGRYAYAYSVDGVTWSGFQVAKQRPAVVYASCIKSGIALPSPDAEDEGEADDTAIE